MISLKCWRMNISKYFIKIGVSATGSFRLDTADFLDTGMMVAVLKQVGTLSYDIDMLKMSVMTLTS